MQAFVFCVRRNKRRNKQLQSVSSDLRGRMIRASSQVAQGGKLLKLKDLDWKYVIGTLLSLVAALLPVYLWQTDLSAYSLTVRLVSSSALQLPSDSKIHDMQIFVNGAKIDSPYIHSLALINTGSKPIPTGSFETPLQIRTMNDAKIITAKITATDPADIPVNLSIEDNQVKILPFLSNPNDQITITLVSSGPLDLRAKARIAGVSDVNFEDTSHSKSRPLQAFFSATVAVLCLALYLFFLPTTKSRGAIKIGGGIRFLSTAALLMPGVYFAINTSEQLNFTGGNAIVVLLPLFLIAGVVTVGLVLSNRAQDPTL
ncbi:hypothetical protein EGM97_17485 [Pseudomonas sp. AF32]|uniref:hypothetical protein n=1 Tax=Pseudomonas sp. AF32 TaxID=554390 RepID=UPI001EEE9D5D|nr:hypothetical protein [Pseudomonas sp. AF32]MCG6576498.1 hypothetical protein [Pseudomonas sp. AF32]